VPENASREGVEGYLRALDRAETALKSDLTKYLPLWRRSIPDESWTFGAAEERSLSKSLSIFRSRAVLLYVSDISFLL